MSTSFSFYVVINKLIKIRRRTGFLLRAEHSCFIKYLLDKLDQIIQINGEIFFETLQKKYIME